MKPFKGNTVSFFHFLFSFPYSILCGFIFHSHNFSKLICFSHNSNEKWDENVTKEWREKTKFKLLIICIINKMNHLRIECTHLDDRVRWLGHQLLNKMQIPYFDHIHYLLLSTKNMNSTTTIGSSSTTFALNYAIEKGSNGAATLLPE